MCKIKIYQYKDKILGATGGVLLKGEITDGIGAFEEAKSHRGNSPSLDGQIKDVMGKSGQKKAERNTKTLAYDEKSESSIEGGGYSKKGVQYIMPQAAAYYEALD